VDRDGRNRNSLAGPHRRVSAGGSEHDHHRVLGQEVGHRWLAFLQFSDHNRQRSNALLFPTL
jgi:hypothetical protein